MGKSSAPKAPDPFKTASAEAQFNRPDVYAPDGSGTVNGYTDENGVFQQGMPQEGMQSAVKTIESETQTAIREALDPASIDITNTILSQSGEGMPGPARIQDRGDVAQNIFDRSFSLMKPALEQGHERLIGNLQARGLPIGGDAFNEAYGNQQRETEETLSRLALGADAQAGQEQSRLFGLEADQRGRALTELEALMAGSFTRNNQAASGNVSPINYSGLVGNKYQADLANYQNEQQQKSSALGTVANIGMALLKCTKEAKLVVGDVNTKAAGEAVKKLPLATWRYKDGQAPAQDVGALHIGPMAEDFQILTRLGDGKTIDPIDFFGLLTAALQDAMHRIEALEKELTGELNADNRSNKKVLH